MTDDDTGQILSAWIAKEELRTLLSTVRVGGDAHLARHRLHRFLAWCIDSQIPELLTLATTIDTWWPEINTFLITGITNVWASHCTSWDRSGSFGVGGGSGACCRGHCCARGRQFRLGRVWWGSNRRVPRPSVRRLFSSPLLFQRLMVCVVVLNFSAISSMVSQPLSRSR